CFVHRCTTLTAHGGVLALGYIDDMDLRRLCESVLLPSKQQRRSVDCSCSSTSAAPTVRVETRSPSCLVQWGWWTKDWWCWACLWAGRSSCGRSWWNEWKG